jgi:hypothetical protein
MNVPLFTASEQAPPYTQLEQAAQLGCSFSVALRGKKLTLHLGQGDSGLGSWLMLPLLRLSSAVPHSPLLPLTFQVLAPMHLL